MSFKCVMTLMNRMAGSKSNKLINWPPKFKTIERRPKCLFLERRCVLIPTFKFEEDKTSLTRITLSLLGSSLFITIELK